MTKRPWKFAGLARNAQITRTFRAHDFKEKRTPKVL